MKLKFIDEFRNKKLVLGFAEKIKEVMPPSQINIMEVCGTHTQSFFRFGLDELLPRELKLIAGPGCPVCVSSQGYIDSAVKLCRDKSVVILTFGDMLRIPGTHSSLEKESACFGNVHIVYSPLDCVRFAKNHPDKKIVFLAVGFETTAPAIALTILSAKKEKLRNLFFLSSLKTIPPVMKELVVDKRLKLQGFLCPGHVSAIIGTNAYEFIAKKYKIACCIAGFEPLDILEGLYLLVRQIVEKRPQVMNQYSRVVRPRGNPRAQKIIARVFKTSDAYWRGFGSIHNTGLKIKKEFGVFDAESEFCIKGESQGYKATKSQCRCADILRGLISPKECGLFSKACTPENPIGPCMVSTEGACNAYYKYHK
ncbi:MAG: hydrogenase formation protein HypD [Candidatus Omnitrophica bacterium]|nr:hydrogenase formation protein HypD [Candidatus Omnitrophota bacterium]MBU1869367.1 hydrogenase formation protein HypD [Candidatus Omnitrophota bacterium]